MQGAKWRRGCEHVGGQERWAILACKLRRPGADAKVGGGSGVRDDTRAGGCSH